MCFKNSTIEKKITRFHRWQISFKKKTLPNPQAINVWNKALKSAQANQSGFPHQARTEVKGLLFFSISGNNSHYSSRSIVLYKIFIATFLPIVSPTWTCFFLRSRGSTWKTIISVTWWLVRCCWSSLIYCWTLGLKTDRSLSAEIKLCSLPPFFFLQYHHTQSSTIGPGWLPLYKIELAASLAYTILSTEVRDQISFYEGIRHWRNRTSPVGENTA